MCEAAVLPRCPEAAANAQLSPDRGALPRAVTTSEGSAGGRGPAVSTPETSPAAKEGLWGAEAEPGIPTPQHLAAARQWGAKVPAQLFQQGATHKHTSGHYKHVFKHKSHVLGTCLP